ncbi:MAG: hypothetical protein IPH85_06455 [Ignavibacteria bacterium]|nr:hypothetical protein [Ignavibacteria bacterium]MBK6417801.1 hypothetical protein [Ignavibacteria bacterium]MBK6760832.1 hypothetical protein [Ignavibacteria bacterium]MBK7031833.1 hypothetical protein [Ignavibacteria bacterium]MBK7185562.1 hypothetical protein [Ignavibacteria bacterium]
MSNIVEMAAGTFTLLSVLTIGFQIALGLGAPWGRFTLGGKYPDVLPMKARLIPVFSTVVLAFFIAIVLTRAGLIRPDLLEPSRIAIWLPVTYMALGLGLNSVSKSKPERRLWVPVILVMLVCTLIVALV